MRIARLIVLPALLCSVMVACGGDLAKESVQPQLGIIDLAAERDGDSTVLSGSSPVAPKVVVPDAALPAGVSSDDLTGTVTYAVDPNLGVTAVQFELGPDGTEFEIPVELSWLGAGTDSSMTAIMAISDAGENLLSREDAAAVLDGMTFADDGDDRSAVTMKIDHFSKWIIGHWGTAIDATKVTRDGLVFVGSYLRFESWSPDATRPSATLTMNWYADDYIRSFDTELCATAKYSVTGGARLEAEKVDDDCSETKAQRVLKLTCDDPTQNGEVVVEFSGYFGVAGLAPMEKFAILMGSKEETVQSFGDASGAFAASSDLALFVTGTLRTPYNCADGVPTTTSIVETTTSTTTSTTVETPTTTMSTKMSTTVSPGQATSTAPRQTTTTMRYGNITTTSYTRPQGPPEGTWIRNDSRCSWRGASSCGVYSGANGEWEEVGPSGGPGSTFTPIAGTSGQIAFNLYAGNSIQNCDWNGTGECGWYFTGTPGTLTMGPTG